MRARGSSWQAWLGRGVLALSLLSLRLPPAAADIWQCRGPDGALNITNVRPPRGSRCRLIVRETPRRPKARRRAARRTSRPSRSSAAPRVPRGERHRRYDTLLREAAARYQLPFAFLKAVVSVESDFTPTALSDKGAMGLMQLMPRTAAAMGVTDPFDPVQNVFGGARYLRVLANRFGGDLVLTIAAYHAGAGAVKRHGGVPPYPDTRRYVQRVLEAYTRFRAMEGG